MNKKREQRKLDMKHMGGKNEQKESLNKHRAKCFAFFLQTFPQEHRDSSPKSVRGVADHCFTSLLVFSFLKLLRPVRHEN